MKNRKERLDDGLTADWLRDMGITVRMFTTTDDKLLQAQKTAHTLLTQHTNQLTTDQIQTLDRKSTRLNSSHTDISRMPSSA